MCNYIYGIQISKQIILPKTQHNINCFSLTILSLVHSTYNLPLSEEVRIAYIVSYRTS